MNFTTIAQAVRGQKPVVTEMDDGYMARYPALVHEDWAGFGETKEEAVQELEKLIKENAHDHSTRPTRIRGSPNRYFLSRLWRSHLPPR